MGTLPTIAQQSYVEGVEREVEKTFDYMADEFLDLRKRVSELEREVAYLKRLSRAPLARR